ncbi:MAG: hypothetical protein ACYTF7_07070 [Planctomycetota bacterium]|jgi:hypothetical protein
MATLTAEYPYSGVSHRWVVVVRWGSLLALGGLLVFAAIAKSMTWQWTQMAIGLGELGVVSLMLTRRRCAMMWLGVMCVFASFLGYTIMRWLGGATSCGCFGAIVVRPEVTAWIDVGAILISGLCAMLHIGSARATGLLVSLTGASAGAGMIVSTLTSPPPPTHYMADEVARLLATEQYGELGSEGGPAWYVFLHNPTCPICKQYLPQMMRLEASSAESESFRVRTIDVYELEALFEPDDDRWIPAWAWGETPIMIELHDGGVVTRQQGHDFLDPEVVAAKYSSSASEIMDPLTRLEGSAWFSPVHESGARYWLVVVGDADGCGEVASRVLTYQASLGESDLLHVAMLTHEQGEAMGMPSATWGGECLGVLYREGERVAQFAGEDIPNPLDLWADLQSGMILEFE